MDISVSASPVWREYGLTEPEVFEQFKLCGFDCVDYEFSPGNQAGWIGSGLDAWAERLRHAFGEAGIRPVIAHVSGFNPLYGSDKVERAVRCAGALGVTKAVVPLGWAKDNTRREYEKANLEYLERLLPVASESGVILMIEHSGSWLEPHYTHHAIELIRVLEMLGEPELLQVSLNTGRLGVAEIKPYTEILMLGGHIRNVDLSDNFGGMPLAVCPEREALGLAPMMGYIDFDRVMQGLKETAYGGGFNLRMNMPRVFPKTSPYHGDAPLRLMPLEITRRLYSWSLHVTEYMLNSYGFIGEERK